MAGGAAAGALVPAHTDAAEPATSTEPAAAATLALTPEGELVVTHAPARASARPTSEEVRRGVPGRRWVMVIDLANCDGCGVCSMTCAKNHFVPSDRQWLRVFRMQDGADTAPYWLPRPCFHCDNPPCARVCPVGATFKRDDGIVLIDNERCIGCRFCMAACPYSVRTFNWSRPKDPPAASARGYSPEWGFPRRVGTAEKCDFCPDMARDGKLPHCAGVCPMGAIWFGDENEDAVTNSRGETVRLSKLLRDRAAYRELEELGTKPRVYYLPPDGRHFPAPGEPGANSGNQHTGVVQR
ncbi:MAG TPA: 4Fe-4S dicluster domain-containing protein [Gemmatimonadaceae bacterium]|nr:4Fe-4S dicluster domain-containing protein [Gemmatimonadaceae bacterium]